MALSRCISPNSGRTQMYDIIEKYGLPRKYVSCPGCGQLYGHHNTKGCLNCAECSKCCRCSDDEKDIRPLEEFMEIILKEI